MNKLRTGDEVIVISGKDRGKTGTITKFLSNDKCEVSGIKIVKKQSPIHISNIAIYNKKTKKADRVKIEINEKAKKRIFKSDGKEIK